MKKHLLKQGLALGAAALFAMGGALVLPTPKAMREVSAAIDTTTSIDGAYFFQDISINNISSTDVNGVAIPDMVLSYQMVPDQYQGTTDQRYATSGFPERYHNVISTTDKGTMMYNVLVNSESLATGTKRCQIEISKDTFFKDGSSQLDFNAPLKVYRYQLKLVGVYTDPTIVAAAKTSVQAADGSISTKLPSMVDASNMLKTGSLMTVTKNGNNDPTVICDVCTDKDSNISKIVIWREWSGDSGDSAKGDGFVADGVGEIKYNVYNLKVSTDFVGSIENSISGQVTYDIDLDNLPKYLATQNTPSLVKFDAGSGDITAATPTANNKLKLSGTMASSNQLLIYGLPVTSSATELGMTSPISYTATLSYGTVAEKDKYNESVYSAANIERVGSDVNTIEKFNTFNDGLSVKYTTGNTNTTTSTNAVTSTIEKTDDSTTKNNIRFVVIDPGQLILVGVVMNYIPGIAMIVLAVGAGFVMFRRRREYR